MKEYQQYYTNELYSNVLVNNLFHISPKNALDLGLGNGNLLSAAKKRWNKIELYGVDIDEGNVSKASLKNGVSALHYDGFSPDLPDILQQSFGDIDLLISNPPYFSKELDIGVRKILKLSGLSCALSARLKSIPAEIVFLAQNLRLLSDGGEIGIILPSGIISGEKWTSLREYLLDNYQVNSCVQLPPKSFKNTEAQAFILFIQASNIATTHVSLKSINDTSKITIDREQAIKRLDHNFYDQIERSFGGHISTNLNVNDFKIFRGNTPHLELKKSSVPFYIHTTSMSTEPQFVSTQEQMLFTRNTGIVGDILLARVGSRCLGRVCYIDKGIVPISDCIIVVRAESEKVRQLIWQKLSSYNAPKDLIRLSLGVGAKYLTHKIVGDYLLDV